MILVDTSVWVDHLRRGLPALAGALDQGVVIAHPFVVGEMALGRLSNRGEVLGLLQRLPMAPVASDSEVRAFIEQRKLMGRGIGYIDVHLLASVVLEDDAALWSHDKRLQAVASDLGIAFAGRN